VTDMNTHEYSKILRLHLLDIARETQRGVDYAIKAYKLANPEFCSIVRECTYDIDVLHREITELVRELLAMELPGESTLRYILASERIANAMRVMHGQAVEIAANSMRIVENGGGLGCVDLATMGELVNSLVRLSVVALFEEDVEHAELVQRCSGVGRLFGSTFYDWYRTLDHRARAQAEFERSITKHLGHVALQACEVAKAIVFWLDDSLGTLVADAGERTLASHETTFSVSNEGSNANSGRNTYCSSEAILRAEHT
jgi:phosphate uptake regulator